MLKSENYSAQKVAMTKLRRSCSVDIRSASNVFDVAKALCLACKQRGKGRRSHSLFQMKSCPSEEVDSAYGTPPRMSEAGFDPGGHHSRSASGASAISLGAGAAAARSLSVNSVSSEGSSESHGVEQEDILVLTHDVKSFKEALGKLRRIFHPDRDKNETMRVTSHERLGEVLRILRSILEKYPPIQSTGLLMSAGRLIQQVKGYSYEDEKSDPSDFFDAIDQLALAFSSRVSEYLMGDLDNSSQPVPKTRSCDNLLVAEGDVNNYNQDKKFATTILNPEEIDNRLAKLADGVDLSLRRAKLWSKYAKDVLTYIEKRCSLEAEHARNVVKLAQTMKPLLKEESFLPFQSIYCMALDQDFENAQTSLTTCSLLQGYKFIEPLVARRTEHEKIRKQIKESWHRELKKMHEAVSNLRKAKSLYLQRQQDYGKAKESALKAENSEGSEASKIDKKRRVEDDACQKAMEAETTYKSCIVEANDRQLSLEKVKAEVLKQTRELIYQCDQTMKAVTVSYFQLQHTISAPAPVQFQTLCESSRLYEPGTQYMEFVKRLPQPPSSGVNGTVMFAFEPYFADNRLDKVRKSNGSTESSEDVLSHASLEARYSTDSREKQRVQQPAKAWCHAVQGAVGSDSDSMSSCPSNKSQDTSPAASPHVHARKILHMSSGDELEADHDNLDSYGQSQRTCMSKAAETHNFRKLKTPSRCRECDSYVYFHGFECLECGLASHKKCLEALAIQCGRKRLPRKMNTFGVDLTAHALDAGENVPYIVNKCIAEIEDKGFYMKGIYRVSGVKSKVEKLCQSFENGAELVDLDGFHPNVIANVLKLYLRQLPEPLLTYRLYPDFIKIAKDYPSQKDEGIYCTESAVEEMQKLVLRLPAVHLGTLACLMHHLHRVSQNSEHNNMPPSNLGIVFGPTLLRTSEGSASLSSLVDTVHQTRVIELLITHTYEIFGPPSYLVSSHKEEAYFQNIQSKSARYHPIEKQSLSRTVSGASQTSDYEEMHHLESGCHSGLDHEDFSLPGFIGLDKSQEAEVSRHGSDITHSSEDLLYSAILSDDDFPEILLPDDSVFKKSHDMPCGQSDYSDRKSSEESAKNMNQNVSKVQDTRASLSSSPAVSEASHSSSLLRSTDDESMSGCDGFWKENLLPLPPPRKSAPSSLSLNQSLLHGSLERKQGASSMSESSGVSSAASTSPTGMSDVGQGDTGNLYTSTATVTLAGQKITTSPGGPRVSTSSAELRRQFFESSKGTPESSPLPSLRGSTISLTEAAKSASRMSGESQVLTVTSQPKSTEKDLQTDVEPCMPTTEMKVHDESTVQSMSCSTGIGCAPQEGRFVSSPQRYVSPIEGSSYRFRGSSFTSTACSGFVMHEKIVSQTTDFVKSESLPKLQDVLDLRSSSDLTCKTSFTSTKSLASDKNVKYFSPTHVVDKPTIPTSYELEGSVRQTSGTTNVASGVTNVSSFECSGSAVIERRQYECGTPDHSITATSEKLSPNRQPRFV